MNANEAMDWALVALVAGCSALMFVLVTILVNGILTGTL